jgi:hypothetical protein
VNHTQDGLLTEEYHKGMEEIHGYEILPPMPTEAEGIVVLQAEIRRLKRRTMHQRRELRSLNKHVRYWSAVAKSKAVIQAIPTIEIAYMNEPQERLQWGRVFGWGFAVGLVILVVSIVLRP